jgi:hypothetical protein
MFHQAGVESKSPLLRSCASALGAAILLTMSSAPAASAPMCGARSEILKQLSARYREVPVALGVSSNGSLVELLTSERGSTWTLMISQPNGPSCLVAAGEGWEELKRVAVGERGA